MKFYYVNCLSSKELIPLHTTHPLSKAQVFTKQTRKFWNMMIMHFVMLWVTALSSVQVNSNDFHDLVVYSRPHYTSIYIPQNKKKSHKAIISFSVKLHFSYSFEISVGLPVSVWFSYLTTQNSLSDLQGVAITHTWLQGQFKVQE